VGEKGISADALAASGLTDAVTQRSESVVERATTVVTSTVTDAGTDLVASVRGKAIDVAAAQVLAESSERLRGRDEGEPKPDSAPRPGDQLPPPDAG
jgi:hypothetical protein